MSTVVQRIKDPSRRDRAVYAKHWAANFANLGWVGLKKGPVQLAQNVQRYPWLKKLLSINQIHDTMTRGRRGLYREANAYLVSSVVKSVGDMLDGVFNHPDKLVLHEDLIPPEILYAMGLKPWMAEFLGIVLPMVEPSVMEYFIDVAEGAGIPPDVCSLPKSTIGLVLEGHMPRPVAGITSNMPCDGGMSQYTIIERELDIPLFRLDVPYDFHSERAVDYFVRQLEELIFWLEEHTPGRMDWDRLREVCEERNRSVEAELDLWDLVRHKPAPMAAEVVYLSHLLYGVACPGTARGTETFAHLAELARRNLEQGGTALEDERYRVALWNPPTMMAIDLFAWAEQAYGVALIMDMLTYHRHPFIDTRTPRSMLRGIAQCMMQGPMARHTRGPAENFFGDLFHFYEHFDLDMIWMAAHIGCKNTQALSGMFREKCRERGIPLLFIDYDLADSRITSAEGIRSQIEQFMETVMRAERLDQGTREPQAAGIRGMLSKRLLRRNR